jgi:hypothetical protein
MMKSLEEQIKCVEREIAMRRRFYPKWVASGKMKEYAARHEIECMEAVLEGLMLIRAGREGFPDYRDGLPLPR